MGDAGAVADADQVTLRPGTIADIPGLRALGEAVVPATYGPIDAAYAQLMLDQWWTVERFTDSLTRVRAIVADRDGEVVAMATFGRLVSSHREFPHVSGDREVMWKLYVHPDHQGAGLGTRLLAEIEALVEGDELWLEVVDGNEQAFAFYRARGFEEVERVAGSPWPDDVWMRKALGARPGRGAG